MKFIEYNSCRFSFFRRPWNKLNRADFYLRQSLRRSRNQRRRAIQSSENQTDGVRSRTLILLMTPSFTIKWKLRCRSRKQKRNNKPITINVRFRASWLVGSSATASDSDNIVFTGIISDGVVNGIGGNGNGLIPPTPIPSNLWLLLRLRLSIFTRWYDLLRLRLPREKQP